MKTLELLDDLIRVAKLQGDESGDAAASVLKFVKISLQEDLRDLGDMLEKAKQHYAPWPSEENHIKEGQFDAAIGALHIFDHFKLTPDEQRKSCENCRLIECYGKFFFYTQDDKNMKCKSWRGE